MNRNLTINSSDTASKPQLWGIFVGIGTTLALLGLLASANLLLSTILATYVVGAAMFAGGVLQLFHAFGVRRLSSALLWGLAGLFYFVAAGIMIADPLLGASFLTMFIGFALAASGLARLILAFRHREGRAWMALSAVFSIAAATLIALGWPWNSLWILGFILAIDLLFQGVMLMLFGFELRWAARPR